VIGIVAFIAFALAVANLLTNRDPVVDTSSCLPEADDQCVLVHRDGQLRSCRLSLTFESASGDHYILSPQIDC